MYFTILLTFETSRVNLICELCQVAFLHYQTEPIVLHNKKLKLCPTQERNQTQSLVQNSSLELSYLFFLFSTTVKCQPSGFIYTCFCKVDNKPFGISLIMYFCSHRKTPPPPIFVAYLCLAKMIAISFYFLFLYWSIAN